jgi:peptide/nickel transport system substrate-binding protein
MYQQQKVELDSGKRHDIVHDMLKLFNTEATYLVLLQDADMQAYRTDRFEGWLQQPSDTGPVVFTNTSPSYANLSVIGGGGDDDGGVNVLLIVGIAVAAVALIGIGAFVVSRRSSDENRE